MPKLFKHRILTFSFACMASVAIYLGLPDEQQERLKTYLKSEFKAFFNLSKSEPNPNTKNRFLPDLSGVDEETAYYFNQILRYSEQRPHTEGPIFKWEKDIYIHLYGNYSQSNKKEVMKVIKELNRLMVGQRIHLVKNPKRANSFIFFGSIEEHNKQTWSGKRLDGQFYGHFHIQSYQQEIQRAYMFVNTQDSNIKRQRHVIREEITQSLGFFNDTYDYPESIFYQGYSERTSFASIDEEIIKLLYQ